jgi:hypothetical protein
MDNKTIKNISGQYTNYIGSKYASNLRRTLLDDLKCITPVLLYAFPAMWMSVCGPRGGPYMMEADRHIYNL